MKLIIYQLATIDYPTSSNLQKRLAKEVAEGRHAPCLLLLEHPHIYTFGRQGNEENLLWDTVELDQRGITLHWSDRGGDVTYHGPGQLVGYPILPIAEMGTLSYLRKLEEVLIKTLAGFGITADRIKGQTGVWIISKNGNHSPAKIASIGVRVDANGITRHGFALNVNPDMSFWKGIIACGLENQAKTSMADLLTSPPLMKQVIPQVIDSFSNIFSMQAEVKSLSLPSGFLNQETV